MRRNKWWIGAAVAAAATAAGTGVAIAGSGGEGSLPDPVREQVERAALEHVGGGTVLESERGDSGDAYEVEVRLPDGTVVEVHLAEDLSVLSRTPDEDTGTDDDGDGTGDDDSTGADR